VIPNAIGINEEGRRQVLAVEIANRESESNWRDFLLGLKEPGLYGVEFVVSGDYQGLERAMRKTLERPSTTNVCISSIIST